MAGHPIKTVTGNSITFEVPQVHLGTKVTYARVTASKGPQLPEQDAYHVHSGQQWAWTQPFWVKKDNNYLKNDPRHFSDAKSLWQYMTKPQLKQLLIDSKEVCCSRNLMLMMHVVLIVATCAGQIQRSTAPNGCCTQGAAYRHKVVHSWDLWRV